jgi:AmiR/NasT family two-component response regulator
MASSKRAAAQGALRVLIVEDDTLVGMGLEAYVRKLGHDLVGRATNATEAVELFAQHDPDLVLMDIKLDGDDGLEVAEALMKRRRVAMIVVSAYSDAELIRRASAVGAYGYLIKPVTAEGLAAQIEVAVGRFREAQQLLAENEQLTQTLETRKLADRAKGILMKRLGISEPEAHKRLQQESQKRRISLQELARKIIESEELLGGP